MCGLSPPTVSCEANFISSNQYFALFSYAQIQVPTCKMCFSFYKSLFAINPCDIPMVTVFNFTKIICNHYKGRIVKFWDKIRKLSNDFKNFKDKIVEKMTSEAKAASTSSTPPNEQDVQFLSDGCDDLVKSGEGVIEGLLKKN